MRLRASSAGALIALAVGVAGCGSGGLSEGGDAAEGKQIFQQKCGGCHTLADAGSAGTEGPDLDAAFRGGPGEEWDESTVREIVAQQTKYAIPPMPDADELFKNPDTRDEKVDAVAAYVASVAAKPVKGGGKIAAQDGKGIFTEAGCGGCHVLRAAGTSGTTGPNLDQSKPGLQEAVGQIRNGGGGMPAYRGRLTDQQIQAVAKFVTQNAGK